MRKTPNLKPKKRAVRKSRRPLDLLREAYRLHAWDRETQEALRQR